VTANVIAPGAIGETEGMTRLSSSDPHKIKDFEKMIPSGRFGTVRDVADATVFLMSDAGQYINGQVIPVDGAAWRRQGAIMVGVDPDTKYPDFLYSGELSKGLKGQKKDKAKL